MRRYALPILLAVALLGTAAWGYYQYNERNDYHTYLDIQFQRQFYELIGHVENAQVELAKAMVSGSYMDMVKYLNNTVSQSYMAQEKLTQLPFEHGSIRRTEKFLSQLGDYTTAMVNKSLEGITLDQSEMETLQELHDYTNFLAQQLIELQKDVVSGGINFGDLRRHGNRNLDRVAEQIKDFNLINIEERMQEYPELIYDGPFSEHLKDVKPRLTGSKVNENQAIEAARKAFGADTFQDLRVIEKIQNTSIPGYYLRANIAGRNNGQEASLAVSETGGKIIWYLNPREIGESKLDREEAVEKAQAFLQEKGYTEMTPTYTIAYEGQAVVNFAYKQEEVIVYTDLIKVKVALDNGEIIGMETEGYLVNHHRREINEPQLSEEQARERLSSGVEVESVRLAMIPTAGNKEVLCYEFKVKFGKDHYLVYIDANEGQQRKLLLMIIQEDGTLVI